MPQIPDGIIRGDKAPASIAEARFKAKAIEKGWKPHRPSWPDYLVETEFGLVGVEVKDKDSISAEQRETFTLLEEAGLPIYVWKRGTECLRRWKPPKMMGNLELSKALPRARSANPPEDRGEDPKGEGNSPTGPDQGEQYPCKATRLASAGRTSGATKSPIIH